MSGPDALVSRSPRKRAYRLLLLPAARERLATAGFPPAPGQRFRAYVHPATRAIALQPDEAGPFPSEPAAEGALAVALPRALLPGRLALGGYRAEAHPSFAAVLTPCPGGGRGAGPGVTTQPRERRSPEAVFAGFSRDRDAILFHNGAARFWADRGLPVKPGQTARIHLDASTGALAFRLAPDGPFRFGRCRTWGAERSILFSAALWRLLGRRIAFACVALPGFDFALAPWPEGSPVPGDAVLPPDAVARLAEVDPGARAQGPPHHARVGFGHGRCALLHFTAAGMRFLRRNGVGWAPGQRVRLFHDPDNGELALRADPDGPHLLRAAQRGRSLVLHSVDLGRRLGTAGNYRMERRDGYDLVLAPVGTAGGESPVELPPVKRA